MVSKISLYGCTFCLSVPQMITSGLLPALGFVNNAINIHITSFCVNVFFISSGYILKNGIFRPYGINTESRPFSKVVALFYIPPAVLGGFWFVCILANIQPFSNIFIPAVHPIGFEVCLIVVKWYLKIHFSGWRRKGFEPIYENCIIKKLMDLEKVIWGWECSSVVGHLPGACKALGFIPSTMRRGKPLSRTVDWVGTSTWGALGAQWSPPHTSLGVVRTTQGDIWALSTELGQSRYSGRPATVIVHMSWMTVPVCAVTPSWWADVSLMKQGTSRHLLEVSNSVSIGAVVNGSIEL